jgi:hypothetical protein
MLWEHPETHGLSGARSKNDNSAHGSKGVHSMGDSSCDIPSVRASILFQHSSREPKCIPVPGMALHTPRRGLRGPQPQPAREQPQW